MVACLNKRLSSALRLKFPGSRAPFTLVSHYPESPIGGFDSSNGNEREIAGENEFLDPYVKVEVSVYSRIKQLLGRPDKQINYVCHYKYL